MTTQFDGVEIQTQGDAAAHTPDAVKARSDADAAAAAASTSVTIEAGEGSGFEGHGQAGDLSGEANTNDKPTRPEGIPEKFWNAETGEVDVEGLAKSYTELEKQRTKSDDPSEEEGSEDPADGDAGDDATDDAVDSAVARAQENFEKNGELSEQDYVNLEKAGIDRATVDAYVAGIESQRLLAFTAVGGEENFTKMSEWAAEHLSEGELANFNAAVGSGDANQILAAVQGLNSRWEAERSVEPGMIEGEAPSTIAGFRSSNEMVQAMSDPRYSKDPAYRSEVEQKIAAAEKAGVKLF